MTVRVAINGFGRMGRLGMRAAWDGGSGRSPGSQDPGGAWGEGLYDIVHVNDAAADAAAAAHLLAFDSVHGRWPVPVGAGDDCIRISRRTVTVGRESRIRETDWKGLGVDLVVEATGRFRTGRTLEAYFDAGVRAVVVACPVHDGGARNIVMGVNHGLLESEPARLVTAASCTTNCLAPVVQVLHGSIGIRHGSMTTIHDATNTQTVVDRPHRDLRRARSSLLNLIPTSTGSAAAIGLIFPELEGKLNGLAVRVPLLNASLVDCAFEMARPTGTGEVNDLFRAAARGALAGILGVEDRPLVSSDFRGDTRSCVIDAPSTLVINGSQVKVLAWYDNEIGYVHRLMELVALVARGLG